MPMPGTEGISLRLVGMVSMRLFNLIADRLELTPAAAMQKVQDRVNEELPLLKALPTTLGDSNRFLFIALKEDNSNPSLSPLMTDILAVKKLLNEFPELKAPDISSEEELFHYVVPDFTIIH